MLEQLWFTWTRTGFSGRVGYQVRAASQGFLNPQGELDTQSERFQRVARALSYRLPDAAEPRELEPGEAPMCLAFQPGNESLLVQKVRRSFSDRTGYFSHLLLDLPEKDAQQTQPLCVRTAIDLWGSAFWQSADHSLKAEERELAPVAFEHLTAGPLSEKDLARRSKELEFALQAVLLAPEKCSVYIAGPAEVVATCIWGITRCLPRTLRLMEHLSFSTYEYTLDPTPYRLVGTCWLSPDQDFPQSWYQSEGEHGWALNCSTGKQTSFEAPALLAQYTHFAFSCLTDQHEKERAKLTDLLALAEQMKLTEIEDLLQLYSAFYKTPSRKKVEWLLYAAQANNVLLSLPRTRRVLLHVIEVEPDWWRVQGKSILSNLLNQTQPTGASVEKVVFHEMTQAVSEKLLEAFQTDDSEGLELWTDVLKVVASPPTAASVWVDLLQRMTAERKTRKPLHEQYRWEARFQLLCVWGMIPELTKNTQVLPWLVLRWNELEHFLSTDIPEDWHITAISIALAAPPVPFGQAMNVLTRFASLFEKALQQLLQDQEMRDVALSFFQALVHHNYPARVDLLGRLLVTDTTNPALAERLLRIAQLNLGEISALLEKSLRWMIEARVLSQACYAELLQRYLTHLDIADLPSPATRHILHALQKSMQASEIALPSPLQTLVRGWSSIDLFLHESKKEHVRLRDLCMSIRDMRELTPSAREKLLKQLLPVLVEQIVSETDLTRVIDSLALGLMAEPDREARADLQLLTRMSAIAALKYRSEYPPIRLTAYIKMALGEARYLLSREQDAFIEDCLTPLLQQQSAKSIEMLEKNAVLWPPYIQLAWRTYLNGHPQTQREEDKLPGKLHPLPFLADGQDQPVAHVGKQKISYEQLRKMYVIKCLYTQYTYHLQRKANNEQETCPVYTELQLRQASLDDLVHSLIIRREIEFLVTQQGVSSANFALQRSLPELLRSFKQFILPTYARLLTNQRINDADIVAALKVFLQEELFTAHLKRSLVKRTLHEWLAARRQKWDISINIL